MKKIIGFFGMLLVLLGICSCSNTNEQDSTEAKSSESLTETQSFTETTGEQSTTETTNEKIYEEEKLPIIRINSSDNSTDFVTEPVSSVVKEVKKSWIFDPNDPQLTAPDPYYVDCKITTTDYDDKALLTDIDAKVKVRGNWTTDYEKKPLRIKFEKKQSMFGLHNNEKYKNWVLLAGYKDWSLLRDSTALLLNKLITNGYVSDFKLVDVYINDNYWGVYLLAEQQQVNKGRIDITEPKDNYEGADIGYLMEYDGYSYAEEFNFSVDHNGYTINDYTKTKAFPNDAFQSGYTLKSDITNSNQVSFIQSYMSNVWKICNEAKKGNYYKFNADKTDIELTNEYTSALECVSKVIDINSLVTTYVIQEIVCDPDIYWSSFYMDVDLAEGKDNLLRFEAPWDFDSSLGNKVRAQEDSTGIYAGKCGRDVNNNYDAANPWMVVFVECDWFMDLVKEVWKKANNDKVFDQAYELIDSSVKYTKAFENNFKRWPNTMKHSGVLDELCANSKKCKTQAEAAIYLKSWLKARVNYLDSIWK